MKHSMLRMKLGEIFIFLLAAAMFFGWPAFFLNSASADSDSAFDVSQLSSQLQSIIQDSATAFVSSSTAALFISDPTPQEILPAPIAQPTQSQPAAQDQNVLLSSLISSVLSGSKPQLLQDIIFPKQTAVVADQPTPEKKDKEIAKIKQIDKPLFTEAEQDSVIVHPDVKDGSTNIAFYIPYGQPADWVWQSETPAIGDKAFLDYWAPTPAVGKYIGVEYANDNQQFSCSGISLDDCLADPHFLNKFNFEILNQ